MELISKPIKPLYFKYLLTAFGSAVVGAIYSMVDMAVVGQYAGPDGTSAIALILPVWSIICSLGILTGIGGSVIYGTIRGKNEKESLHEANKVFTSSFIFTLILAIIITFFMFFFCDELFKALGGKGKLFELGMKYLSPLRFAVPFLVFSQMLGAFLRNDNDPTLATIAIVSTALLNIVGDYVLTFTFDLGIFGTALATTICSILSVIIMCFHFFKKSNTLKFVKPDHLFKDMGKIFVNGFSTFVVDIVMGFLTMLYNHQIIRYLNNDALSIFGVIATIGTVVQCCSYSIGQASQPILSANYGASKYERIKQVLKYAVITSIIFGLFWWVLTFSFPNLIIKLFIKVPSNSEILKIAPIIVRKYTIAYLFVPFTIFTAYYFQSIMRPVSSLVISLARGIVLSGIFVIIFPIIFGSDNIWLSSPVAEGIVGIVSIILIIIYTKKLTKNA